MTRRDLVIGAAVVPVGAIFRGITPDPLTPKGTTAMSDTDASRVNLVRTGPRGGAPVVLVHPVGLDLTYWDRQIEDLRGTRDVIAFDLPGHGRTPGGPADWTFDKAAATLAEVISSARAGRAHVVGISVGGMIAQALALSRPDLVRSLVLIGTAASFPEQGRQALRARAALARGGGMTAVLPSTIERWFTPGTVSGRPDVIDRVAKTLLHDDPAVHAAMWDMIATLDFADRLDLIEHPTLILVGDLDPSCPPSAARALQTGIAGSRLEILPETSHIATLERPDLVNRHISEFLARLDA